MGKRFEDHSPFNEFSVLGPTYKNIPNRFFGIRDLTYFKAGARNWCKNRERYLHGIVDTNRTRALKTGLIQSLREVFCFSVLVG